MRLLTHPRRVLSADGGRRTADDDDGMTRPSSGDRRWLAAIILTTIGGIVVLLTRALRGDNWMEFAGTAAYSIGWALLTFGGLYLLSKQFEDWEWGRPDHDLTEKFEDGLE